MSNKILDKQYANIRKNEIKKEKEENELIKGNSFLKIMPKKFAKIKDYQQIALAINPEWLDINKSYQVVVDNQFIQTADDKQISLYERMLNLKVDPSLDLPARRIQVLLKYQEILPFTLPKLKEKLNSIAGFGNWAILINYNEYQFLIEVLQSFNDLVEIIIANLIGYIPAHLHWTSRKRILIEDTITVYYGGYIANRLTYEIYDKAINKPIIVNQNSIPIRLDTPQDNVKYEQINLNIDIDPSKIYPGPYKWDYPDLIPYE